MARGLVGDGLQLVGPEVLDLAGVLDLGGGRTIALWLERKLYWLLYLNLKGWCIMCSRPREKGGGRDVCLGGGGGGHGHWEGGGGGGHGHRVAS